MSALGQFFIGFKKGMQNFGHNLTLIVNSILLSIVYCIGIGITSIVAKIFRKHFLETKALAEKETYWSDLDLKTRPFEDYYRQF